MTGASGTDLLYIFNLINCVGLRCSINVQSYLRLVTAEIDIRSKPLSGILAIDKHLVSCFEFGFRCSSDVSVACCA